MRQRFLHLMISALVMSGCSFYKVDSQSLSQDFFLPKESVESVTYLEKAEALHEVIGLVTVTTDPTRPLNEVIDQMRQEAAVMGGDALTELHSDALTEGASAVKGKRILVKHTAKVIVLK